MKTRIIHTKIWQDSFFVELNPVEKLLFIYYLTNENVNIIHLYECSIRKTIFDTGVTQEELTNAKNKFQANKKFYYHNDFIYITNASRYEEYKGTLNETAKSKIFSQLGKEVLDWYYSISDTPIYTPFKGSINKKPEIINDKPEIRNHGEWYQSFLKAKNLLVNKTTLKS